MPNIQKDGKSDKARFVEDLSGLLVPWGMPAAAARIYGYLLLRESAISLDQIAVDLEMSKSTASVAARALEIYAMVRRRGERGSKRVLYEISDNYAKMLVEQNRLLDAIAAQLRAGADLADSGSVRSRLEEMSGFYLLARRAMEEMLHEWQAQRSSSSSRNSEG